MLRPEVKSPELRLELQLRREPEVPSVDLDLLTVEDAPQTISALVAGGTPEHLAEAARVLAWLQSRLVVRQVNIRASTFQLD